MARRWLVRPNAYYDSVKLLRVSEALGGEPGVIRAAAVMGTPLNRELLAADDLLEADVAATPEDLVVAVLAETEDAAAAALQRLDALLAPRPTGEGPIAVVSPRTVEEVGGGGTLAVIAVPGPYAAVEAYAALRAGMHVFLFSDNVPLEDEVRLKHLAAELGLLLMGPDCGTAILDGVGLGFANRVTRGPVGIVGASGTGIQQVCSLLDAQGIGIAQAIGTGGRDLSAEVGGSMTRRALQLLERDEAVEVIVVISKPADEKSARDLYDDLAGLSKPSIACLLRPDLTDEWAGRSAATLTEAAEMVASLCGAAPQRNGQRPVPARRSRRRGCVYGLFAGGTLCGEAGQVLDALHVPHRLLDLGADEYTRGRAHPLIDPRLRAGMLAELGSRSDLGAVLFDVILGDLAHPDPAVSLLPALAELRARQPRVPLIATLVGTRADPQGLDRQRALLEDAGVRVFGSNARAAAWAGAVLGGGGGE